MDVSSASSVGKIEKGNTLGAGTYWKVQIDANKLVTPSGKKLPYATWIGTIGDDGRISLWYPAASVPRDYKKAAMALLLVAFNKLYRDGHLKPSPLQLRRYQKLHA